MAQTVWAAELKYSGYYYLVFYKTSLLTFALDNGCADKLGPVNTDKSLGRVLC